MIDLHYLTAAEALRLFRVRELSPVELVSAVINRAEAEDDLVTGLALEGQIYAPLGQLLEDFDALVCPTFAVPAL